MRYLHLTGSAVDPLLDDVSRLYARGCLDAVGGTGEHVIAHVSPGGAWRFPDSLDPDSLAAAAPLSLADAVARLVAARRGRRTAADVLPSGHDDLPRPARPARDPLCRQPPRRDGHRRRQAPGLRDRRRGRRRGPDVAGGARGRPAAASTCRWWSSPPTPTTPWESRSSATHRPTTRQCAAPPSTPTECWSRPTSSWAARCGAASSRRLTAWSACLWRSTPSTPTPSRCATTPTSSRATTTATSGLVAKDAAHAWIVDASDPVNAPGPGGRPAGLRGARLPPPRTVRLPRRPAGPAPLPRGVALLLVRAVVGDRGDGRGRRDPAA